MSQYIVASCKEWHRPKFDSFVQGIGGTWHYVNSTEDLELAVLSVMPRYIFFLHWSWIVSPEIFKKYECICFHMTDVPYGRGGSPLQNLIVDGKTETIVTALRMEKDIDAGPIYSQRPMSLQGRAEEIYMRAVDLCWEMIREIVATAPNPIAQKGDSTMFQRRKPEQSELPLHGGMAQLYDHIRMLDAPSYPLAFIEYGSFRLEFTHAELKNDEVHARVVFYKFNR